MSKFCTNCGQKIEDRVKFCVNCGKQIKKINEDEKEEDKVTTQDTFQSKSKIVAGLLGIFLGSFGIHNFYLGYNGKGVTQLLLTILTSGLLSLVSSVWGIVEGIMILIGYINVDAKGNPLGI